MACKRHSETPFQSLCPWPPLLGHNQERQPELQVHPHSYSWSLPQEREGLGFGKLVTSCHFAFVSSLSEQVATDWQALSEVEEDICVFHTVVYWIFPSHTFGKTAELPLKSLMLWYKYPPDEKTQLYDRTNEIKSAKIQIRTWWVETIDILRSDLNNWKKIWKLGKKIHQSQKSTLNIFHVLSFLKHTSPYTTHNLRLWTDLPSAWNKPTILILFLNYPSN